MKKAARLYAGGFDSSTDREGFEPSVQLYTVHRISNPAPSASRAPIQSWG